MLDAANHVSHLTQQHIEESRALLARAAGKTLKKKPRFNRENYSFIVLYCIVVDANADNNVNVEAAQLGERAASRVITMRWFVLFCLNDYLTHSLNQK